MSLDWGSAAVPAAADAADAAATTNVAAPAAAASPAPVDCITGCCREACGAAAGLGSPCAWIRRAGVGNCAALCSEDIQRGRTSPLGVRGCSVRAGRLFL